jgi:hypothetical protein
VKEPSNDKLHVIEGAEGSAAPAASNGLIKKPIEVIVMDDLSEAF